MKLNKDNKRTVAIGDVLRDSCGDYTVTNVIEGKFGISFTLRLHTGQTLYAYPSSKCYGMEIIKKNEGGKSHDLP